MKNDGALFDATEQRSISHAELREYLRDGGLFEARRHETGADCTYEVLQSVISGGALHNLVPGVGAGSLPGVAAVPGLGGLAQLSGLVNGGGLVELARVLGSDREAGGDDREEPRSKAVRRRSDGRDWADGEWREEPQS